MDNKLISDFVAALEQLSSPELVLKVSNTHTYMHICTHLHMLHTCTLRHDKEQFHLQVWEEKTVMARYVPIVQPFIYESG